MVGWVFCKHLSKPSSRPDNSQIGRSGSYLQPGSIQPCARQIETYFLFPSTENASGRLASTLMTWCLATGGFIHVCPVNLVPRCDNHLKQQTLLYHDGRLNCYQICVILGCILEVKNPVDFVPNILKCLEQTQPVRKLLLHWLITVVFYAFLPYCRKSQSIGVTKDRKKWLSPYRFAARLMEKLGQGVSNAFNAAVKEHGKERTRNEKWCCLPMFENIGSPLSEFWEPTRISLLLWLLRPNWNFALALNFN